jgi:hypothetical protein
VRCCLTLTALAACGAVAACSVFVDGTSPDAGTGSDGGGGGDDDGGWGGDDDAGGGIQDIAAVPPGCTTLRSTPDRPDDHGFDQIRVLYVIPSDGVDAGYDTNGRICNSVRAFATWFHAQSNVFLRFDTQGGMLDIGFVRLPKTDAQMRGNDPNQGSVESGTAYVLNRIDRELRLMGLHKNNKLYAYYYDGSSTYACGGGAYPPLVPGRSGAMYLRGLPPGQTTPCGQTFPWGQASLTPNYIDYGMLHELVHAMGIVVSTAPHQHSVGHVYDVSSLTPNRDLMYSPRSSSDPGWATNSPSGLLLDIGNDDYFGANLGVELSRMSLIAPLPVNPRRPSGW